MQAGIGVKLDKRSVLFFQNQGHDRVHRGGPNRPTSGRNLDICPAAFGSNRRGGSAHWFTGGGRGPRNRTPPTAAWNGAFGGGVPSALMPVVLKDGEIRLLLRQAKQLPKDYVSRLTFKPKPGHKCAEIEVTGEGGNRFWLILRQSSVQPLDFSVIVAYQPPGSYGRVNLRRYNGKSHVHRNALEDEEPFYDFHIHEATERYQRAGYARPESFATPTDRYGSLNEALDCAISDCGFRVKGGQRNLVDPWPGQ